MEKSRAHSRKVPLRRKDATAQLKRLEAKFIKKKDELLEIKALHRKKAGEFIDLWMEIRRLKRKR